MKAFKNNLSCKSFVAFVEDTIIPKLKSALHGFRTGCAITLALTGADLSEIMEHVG